MSNLVTLKKSQCHNRRIIVLNRLIDRYYRQGIDINAVQLHRHIKDNNAVRNALQVLICYRFIDKKISNGAI